MADYLSEISRQRADEAARYAPLAYPFFQSWYEQIYKDSDRQTAEIAAVADLKRELIIVFNGYCNYLASDIWRRQLDAPYTFVTINVKPLPVKIRDHIVRTCGGTASHLSWLENCLLDPNQCKLHILPGLGELWSGGQLILDQDSLAQWAACFDWNKE